jgi:hypothetical protein
MRISATQSRVAARHVEEDSMLWVAVVLLIGGVVVFTAGFVLFANGVGVAPHNRTQGDPTGVKRAASRVSWRDLFRRVPGSVNVMLNKQAARSEKLTASGSLLVLIGVVALGVAVLAFLAALL